MKSKVIIFLCVFLLPIFCIGQVPNNEIFTLEDVVNEVSPSAASASPSDKIDLQDCFNAANPNYFDPDYNNDNYAPSNSLLRFRNYKIDLLANVVSVWKLDDHLVANAIINDATSNNQDGTVSNAYFQSLLAGKIGYSMGMTGDAMITNTVSTRPPFGYTFSLWLYPTFTQFETREVLGISMSTTSGILRETLAIVSMSVLPTQYQVVLKVGTSVTQTFGYLTRDAWNHIVVTRSSGGVLKLYINGALAHTKSTGYSSVGLGTSYTYFIGRNNYDGTRTADGRYDQFCLWLDRAFDLPAVQRLWNNGNGRAYVNW